MALLGRIALLLAVSSTAAFHLYLPSVNKAALIDAYGITEGCFNAINSTLQCDPYNIVNALDVDDYVWSSQNLTDLCTTSCANDLKDWLGKVKSNCGEQTVPIAGKEAYATYFPLRYQNGFDTACLKSGSGSWCIPEAYEWEGKSFAQYPEDYCLTGDPVYDPPECYEFDFRPTYTKNDSRIIGLYPKDLICDDCFVKVWQQRLKSPMLMGENQKEYLQSNYEDIQALCSIKTPATTFSGALTKGTIVPTPTTSTPAQTTCAGETLPIQTGQSNCRQLAEEYQVPYGTLRQLSGTADCTTTTPLCLPARCDLHMINGGQTCSSAVRQINDKYGTNITHTQFLTWNPYILGICDNLNDVQQACRGPPGGAYAIPDPIGAPTAGTYYTTALPALPTQSGTIKDCGRYYNVVEKDICQVIAMRHGISLEQFFEYNTYLTKDCMNLWAKSSVCVAQVVVPPVSTNGNCGPEFEHATCGEFGKCCSTAGKCGSTEAECAPGSCYSGDCLPGRGSETPDGKCGPDNYDWVCGDSAFGKCCSVYGWCGDSSDHCAPGNCHSGDCDQTLGGPSTDGSCGPNFPGDKICAGTHFGKCCSNYGYCGDSDLHCGKGNCHSGECEI